MHDATTAAKVPGLDGMLVALTNFIMIASEFWTAKRAVESIQAAAQ